MILSLRVILRQLKKIAFAKCKADSRIKKRQGPKKSASNVQDVYDLFQAEGTNIPTFVAGNLNALPPISFDNIDVSVLFTSIEQNNTKVDALQLGLQMQNDTISKLQNTVDLLTGQIEQMCIITQRSTADVQTYAQGIQKEFLKHCIFRSSCSKISCI